jgi:hypothetical protein
MNLRGYEWVSQSGCLKTFVFGFFIPIMNTHMPTLLFEFDRA